MLNLNPPIDPPEEEETPESGFKFNNSRYNWAKDKGEQRNEEEPEHQNNNDDDEDSSSFLRMIMD